MFKTFCEKYLHFLVLAIIVLANVYGGFFTFLSGVFVALFMFVLLIGVVGVSILLYAVNTGKIDKIDKPLPSTFAQSNHNFLNYAVTGATYVAVGFLHWYTALAVMVVLHASIIALYQLNKKKLLSIYTENPGT